MSYPHIQRFLREARLALQDKREPNSGFNMWREAARAARGITRQQAVQQFRQLDMMPSKVVDNNTSLARYYHELAKRILPKSSKGRQYLAVAFRGINPTGSIDEGWYGKGTYYALRQQVAREYAHGGRVVKSFLQLKKPYVFGEQVADTGKTIEELINPDLIRARARGLPEEKRAELKARLMRRTLEYRGYDALLAGAINRNYPNEVVVFHPEKSALTTTDVTHQENVKKQLSWRRGKRGGMFHKTPTGKKVYKK